MSPGLIDGPIRLRHRNSPVWIVIQDGAQPRASHSPTFCQDDLANKKRAARAALEGGRSDRIRNAPERTGADCHYVMPGSRSRLGRLLCRASPPRSGDPRGHISEYEQAQRREWPGRPGTKCPGGHDEVNNFIDEPRAPDANVAACISEALTREKSCQQKCVPAARHLSHIIVLPTEIAPPILFESDDDD